METHDNKAIGRRLKAARKDAGLESAKEAAASLGMNYSTYAGHENGNRGVVRAAETYARRYRVSLDWLLRGKGDGPLVQPEDVTSEAEVRDFLDRIPGLRDEDVRFLLKNIRSALVGNGAAPLQTHPHDQSTPANARHE